jgi:hypothetical protein
MTKVVLIVQGVVLEGNLPDGVNPEDVAQIGPTLELGRVRLVGMAVHTVPTMRIRTSDIGAIALSPVEGLELGPIRKPRG